LGGIESSEEGEIFELRLGKEKYARVTQDQGKKEGTEGDEILGGRGGSVRHL